MEKYVCTVCDWVYDPTIGDPEGGIAPGTKFEDIPDDWVCPVCGVGKDLFEPVKYQDAYTQRKEMDVWFISFFRFISYVGMC